MWPFAGAKRGFGVGEKSSRPRRGRRAGTRGRTRFQVLRLEQLEGRTLLSVNWSGMGDGTSWSEPSNWYGGAVPGVNDDAVIGLSGSNVAITADVSVQSISVVAGATLSVSGAALSVTASSTIDGGFSMTGGSLNASGGGVTFTVNGATTISDSGMDASAGATIDLPQLTSYSSTNTQSILEADGTGSTLELANLSSIAVASPVEGAVGSANASRAVQPDVGRSTFEPSEILASNGGVVDLPALQDSPHGDLLVEPDGAGSAIELTALLNFQSGQWTETAGGTIVAPLAVQLQDVGIQADPTASFTLSPNQSYVSANASDVLYAGTLIDQGSLSVLAGLDLTGSLAVDGQGALSIAPGATLDVSGDLLGNTTNADDFNPLGTVYFDSSTATADSPQHLEAMSADEGAVAAGFQNNFAYGTLDVAAGSALQLVDQSHNSSAPQPEAVYANELTLEADTTLDLNGLHLYVRNAFIDPTATVINGSVSILPTGGSLTIDTPVSAALSSDETTSWTFYGRAGQVATVELNPVDLNAPESAPQLNYGQVTLLDPNNTFVASAASTYTGDVATIADVTLPSDGTYTIHVQAAQSEPSSAGDYILTTYLAIPSVRPLTVNQPYSGDLANPAAIDRWTFSAAANQQIDLHVLNTTAGNDANFALVGPGGSTVFSGVPSDSGPVDLPSTGAYVLSVAGNGGGYAFAVEQTSVIPLTVGGSYSGTMSGSGYSQLFSINVPTNEALNVNLQDSSSSDVNELYARHGSPPTRGIYDFSATAANSANQQLLVPSADPGTWYVLVYGNGGPASSYTLQVSTTPMTLTAVTPNQSAEGSTPTLVLNGGGFDNTTTVQLLGAGNLVYHATSTSLDLFTQLSATFNLTGVSQGSYAVQVTRGDGATATLPAAFTVTAPGQAKLVTQLIVPGIVGRHIASTFYIEYSNTGNVAMPAPVLVLQSSVADDLPLFTLNPALVYQGFWTSAVPAGYSNSVQIVASGKVPGVLEPGESVTVPVYYAGMEQPWNFSESTFAFNLQEYATSDTTAVNWSSMQAELQPSTLTAAAWGAIYANLTSQIGSTWGAYVQMLDNEAAYLGTLGENITSVGQLWRAATLQVTGSESPAAQQNVTTDIQLQIPGTLSLSFTRQHFAAISNIDTLGPLGYGWNDNWQYSLARAGDGTVTVTMPTGDQRVFQPDSVGSSYFDQPGDHGTLLAGAGGTFTLTESNGQIEAFNANGTLNYVEDAHGNRITAGYSDGELTSLTATASGSNTPIASLTIAYNNSGLIESVTSSDGRTIQYTYDGDEQLTQVLGYDGLVTQYAYDTSGNAVTLHALTAITAPNGTHEYFTYDALGRLAGSSLDGGADPITYSYNAGKVTTTDAVGDATSDFFNANGQLVKTVDPLGNVTVYTYDNEGNRVGVTGPTGLTETYTYDANGSVASSTNALGQTQTSTYSGPDNLLASTTDADGNTTTYQYDAAGDSIATEYADGSVSKATYDAEGDPLSLVNGDGQVTNYTYNAAGQITGETLADGTSYTFTFDAQGNRITATSAAGTIHLSYNSGDQLTEIAYPNGQSLTYTYNALGQRIEMVEKDNNTVTGTVNYQYDAAGRLTGLTDGTAAPIVTYLYNELGQLEVAVNGSGTGSGTGPYSSPYTTYQYDADGNLLHVVNYAGGTTVNSRFDYTYNALGQVTTMATINGTWSYSYDAAGELIGAALASTNGAIPSQNLSYVYNAAGDRTQTIINGTTTNYSSNSVNEYTSTSEGTTYQYDEAGNLISETNASGTTTYTYNSINQLISVVSPTDSYTYQYDALGNLAVTTHDTLSSGQVTGQTVTQNLVDPAGTGDVVQQFDGSGDLTAGYTYGLGLVSQVTSQGSDYYQFDALGSTADLTNSSGTVLNSYSYLPFGSALYASGTAVNPFTFVGSAGVSSDGSGLLNMRARSYDPTMGQFVSEDPARLAGGDLNLRRYAQGNPTDAVDPTGNVTVTVYYSSGAMGGFGHIGIDVDGNLLNAQGGGGPSAVGSQTTIPGVLWAGAGDIANNSVVPLFGGSIYGYYTSSPAADAQQQQFQVSQAQADAMIGMINTLKAGQQAANGNGWYNLYTGNCSQDVAAVLNAGGYNTSGLDNLIPALLNNAVTNIVKSQVVQSQDPNGMVGPVGYGSENFVNGNQLLSYEIDFENSPTATAPAQSVTISDPLDANLDPSTFQLTEIAFGATVLTIPAGTQYYENTVSMTYNNQTFNVEITAGINLTTDTVFATFESVDPNTGLPPNVLAGFLPPEDGSGRGQGKIDYTIRANSGLPTGTQIHNVATINFDNNGIIATDQVNDEDPSEGIDPTKQALMTVDSSVPTSSVATLPADSASRFAVTWSGSDDDGSGIASYSVYVSDNGGPFTLFQSSAAAGSATFAGQVGHTYGFYSVATSNVGNSQSTPSAAQTSTTAFASTFTLTGPSSGTFSAGQSVTIQWTAANVDVVGPTKISLGYDLAATVDANEHWIEVNGGTAANSTDSYTWNVVGVAPGTYYLGGYMYDFATSQAVYSHVGTSIVITGSYAPPAFTLLGPSAGTFSAGVSVTIQWTATSVDVAGPTKISLGYDPDTTAFDANERWITVNGVTAANGAASYRWNTTGVASGTYYLGGYMYDFTTGQALYSHLGTPIVLTGGAPPAFTLLGPRGGTFSAGVSVTILWTASNVDVAGPSKISLGYDPDTTAFDANEHWITVNGVTAANGAASYGWNTTGVASGTYYLGGYMYDFATSEAVYSHLGASIVISGGAPPAFTLLGPSGGTFSAGVSVTILWTATNVDVAGPSKISLGYDPDTTAFDADEHWIEVDRVTAANGAASYSWNTTGVASGTYYLSGYMYDFATSQALYSHLAASIVITGGAPPAFTLTGPSSITFAPGAGVTIQWTVTNVDVGGPSKITLGYDANDAVDANEHWIEIDGVALTAANGTGSYAWNTASVAAGTYYLGGYMYDFSTSQAVYSHLGTSIVVT